MTSQRVESTWICTAGSGANGFKGAFKQLKQGSNDDGNDNNQKQLALYEEH